jgi:hypothetical protein
MGKKQTVLTFKRIRIGILLVLLVTVALGTYYQRTLTANWLRPLSVTIYPVNGDGSNETASYIRGLTSDEFEGIARFLVNEAEAFKLIYKPIINVTKGDEVSGLPPTRPSYGEGRFAIARWSLNLRHWVYQKTSSFGLDARHIRIFVIYVTGKSNQRLAHSYGLQKGLIGVVYAFANEAQRDQNKVIIAHEMLHTLGATDKYDQNGFPLHPDGFAEPDKNPLYPQEYAEIMAGRLAETETEARTPDSLAHCIVGTKTAQEIKWL